MNGAIIRYLSENSHGGGGYQRGKVPHLTDLHYIFDSFMKLWEHDFSIYGFTVSFKDIFILSILLIEVSIFLYKVFGGD